MTKLIVIALVIYAIAKAIRRRNERQEAERAEQERRRIREEQARQREEIRQQIELAKEQTRRQIALEREQMKLRREQDRQRREQERQAQEQERQRKEQIRQAEQLAELDFRVTEAEAAILDEQKNLNHYTAKLSDLDEQVTEITRRIRYYEAAHDGKSEAKARAELEKVEDKIFTIEGKVRACEKRMAKAQHIKETAQRKRTA